MRLLRLLACAALLAVAARGEDEGDEFLKEILADAEADEDKPAAHVPQAHLVVGKWAPEQATVVGENVSVTVSVYNLGDACVPSAAPGARGDAATRPQPAPQGAAGPSS